MQRPEFQHVLMVGAGHIGLQVALHCAAAGSDVIMFDVSRDALESAQQKQKSILDYLVQRGRFSAKQAAAMVGRIQFDNDAESASHNADLLIESVPEDIELKRKVFAQFNHLCPAETIFTTNTSTLLPSTLAHATGRAAQFAALHFVTNYVLQSNIAEFMAHPQTSDTTKARLERYANQIAETTIVCRREHPGYVFNALTLAWNCAALTLVERGLATVEEIDRTWARGLDTSIGPFATLDLIGLDTVHTITRCWANFTANEQDRRNADYLQKMVDSGRLGTKSRQGFYTYSSVHDVHRIEPPSFKAAQQDALGTLPLLDPDSVRIEGGTGFVSSTFDQTTDAFLADHRYRRVPTLPVGIMAELMAEGACLLANRDRISAISAMRVFTLLRFHTDAAAEVRVTVRYFGERVYCELRHDLRNRAGQLLEPNHLIASGVIELSDDRQETYEQPAVTPTWHDVVYLDDAPAYLGPSLRCLKQLHLDNGTMIGAIETPSVSTIAPQRAADGWLLNPAVLDAALLACAIHTHQTRQQFQLPTRIDRITIARTPATTRQSLKAVAYVRPKVQPTFDICVLNDSGELVTEIDGYVCQTVRPHPHKNPAAAILQKR